MESKKDFVAIKKTAKPNKLSIWMYIIVALRSYFLQSGFNYSNFQGLGYAYIIYPGLKKIYGKNTPEFKNALLENIEFFNSNPQTIPLITSIHLSLLSNGQSVSDARTIKMSLMGPLSGIGDSLSQYAIFPLFSIIAIGFASSGNLLGPFLFLIGMNGTLLTIKIILGILGYKLGEAAISKLSAQMQSVIRVSAMIGITIIAALSVRLTKIKFALQFSERLDTGTEGLKNKDVSLQEIMDNILPFLGAALWIVFIYIMITKFKWTAYKVIIVTLIVGVTLGVFGILGAPQ